MDGPGDPMLRGRVPNVSALPFCQREAIGVQRACWDLPLVVQAAIPDVANSRFQILLNKAPTVSVKVGWFVVN
jgi:hypothetical protein